MQNDADTYAICHHDDMVTTLWKHMNHVFPSTVHMFVLVVFQLVVLLHLFLQTPAGLIWFDLLSFSLSLSLSPSEIVTSDDSGEEKHLIAFREFSDSQALAVPIPSKAEQPDGFEVSEEVKKMQMSGETPPCHCLFKETLTHPLRTHIITCILYDYI